MMKRSFISVLIIISVFSSCKKDPIPAGNVTVEEKARGVLYGLMNYWYYWSDVMPEVDTLDYADPYELMDAMRYKPLDRWSFVEDYDAFVAYYAGSFVGHGFRIGVDAAGKARIVTIYNKSPLYAEGVRRGWIVKSINGYDIAAILISRDASAYSAAIGAAETGVINTFVFVKPTGTETTIVSAKQSFNVNSVLLYDTIRLSTGATAGHLVFDSFIEPSFEELSTAFAFFKQNNVSDLILDLRYNSGGMLNVARDLASYIAGNSKAGTTFVKMKYNRTRQSNDTTYNFKDTAYPLGLSRLAVITSRSTASASEVVINGLKPYMPVVCFGDTTEGKPTGMDIWNYENTYVFAPVTFKDVNSADDGDFFNGFAPAKLVADDITHDFDDRNELCLKEAIKYLETGTVSTKGQYIYKKSIQVSERPEWQNNLFVNFNK
jgi:carboxyl-terminal processing protease